MHLSNAIQKIRYIKTEVSKQNYQMYDKVMSAKLDSLCMLPALQEACDGTIKDDFKVGFVEEERRIIDFLVSREAGRKIAAVIGMGRQGKMHLARRVFQDKRIKNHFYKLAWSNISQAYDVKKVFRDILEGFGETFSPKLYESLTREDLGHKLRKCLMGQKYLIVLDDMWDAKAWFDFQESFPDVDRSRILLTSQNLDVALKVEANCAIGELFPLSREESWNLLRMKAFNEDYCPPSLFEIGKTILESCKGIPLAIVLVAGLLKKDKDVEFWKQISKSVKVHMANEGCMDIVELSYKYLPDYLKPNFLYLAVFEEDEIIDAKKLIQFWIAEGFVQIDGMKRREIVAKDYLMELVSRSLVVVSLRSSRNGIKKCYVHDLVHQLCLIKDEERFFLASNDVSDCSSTQSFYDYPRIIVGKNRQLNALFDFPPLRGGVGSLVDFGRWFHDLQYPVSLKEFKLLRVLNLPNVNVTEIMFDDITVLIHLRLLVVGYMSPVPIPPSVINPLRLEGLRFIACVQVRLPSAVIKMASLRHIFAAGCVFDYIDWYDQLVPYMSSFPLSNLETSTSVYFYIFYDELSFKEMAPSSQNILRLGFVFVYGVSSRGLNLFISWLSWMWVRLFLLPHWTSP